jgi:hypothetical protein
MGYDKKSFLAGLSAGTQLKGWSSYPSEAAYNKYSTYAPKRLPNPPLLVVNGDIRSENYSAPKRLPNPPLIEVFSFLEV